MDPSLATKSAEDIDRALMRRVAAGHQDALRQLIDRHGHGVTALARRYLSRSADVAEDVAQEVFIAVWRKAQSFDPDKGRVAAWIYRIAANRCIDLARRRALLRFVGLDAAAGVGAETPDGETAAASRSELAQARAGIAALPRRQRLALLLRAVGDLDVPEIATAMGTTSGSVEQLLVRARRALRQHMNEASHER